MDNEGTHLNFSDHLNSSSVTTDADGDVTNLIDYLPFGAERVNIQNGEFESSYKFTNKERDEESNLDYFGARYYKAAIGRFTQVDPRIMRAVADILADPQTLNGYAYARNNPIMYIDPNGESPVEAGWGMVVGFVQRAPQIVGSLVKGVYNYFFHPKQTIQNITNAVIGLYNTVVSAYENPTMASQAIAAYAGMGYDEFMGMDDYGRGKVIGGFLADGAAIYYGGKFAGKAADAIKGGSGAMSFGKFMNYFGKIKSETGLYGIGSASRSEAMELGKIWTGAAKEIIEDGKVIGYSSEGGLKAFRLDYKPKLDKWQANYQENFINANGESVQIRNAHLDIE